MYSRKGLFKGYKKTSEHLLNYLIKTHTHPKVPEIFTTLLDMWCMRRIMQLFHQIFKNAVIGISNVALIKAKKI